MPACEISPVQAYCPTVRSMPEAATPAAAPNRMERGRDGGERDGQRRQRGEQRRDAARCRWRRRRRSAPAARRAGRRTFNASPCATDRFPITSPAATAASSGSNCCDGADAAEQSAHREQHQRYLASDVPEIQGEQRADQAAKRNRPADLPGESHDDAAAVHSRCQTPRASCIAIENRSNSTRSARTTTASTSSLRRPRAPVSVATAAVIVGEKLTTMMVNSDDNRQSRRAAGVRCHRQPRPRQPCDEGDARRCDSQRRESHAHDASESIAEPLEAEGEACHQRDQRRRDASNHRHLCRHRLGDDVRQVWARRARRTTGNRSDAAAADGAGRRP